jgi:hypothetical protein
VQLLLNSFATFFLDSFATSSALHVHVSARFAAQISMIFFLRSSGIFKA